MNVWIYRLKIRADNEDDRDEFLKALWFTISEGGVDDLDVEWDFDEVAQ